MRSSHVVRVSDCQCQSRNSPGFDPDGSEGRQTKQYKVQVCMALSKCDKWQATIVISFCKVMCIFVYMVNASWSNSLLTFAARLPGLQSRPINKLWLSHWYGGGGEGGGKTFVRCDSTILSSIQLVSLSLIINLCKKTPNAKHNTPPPPPSLRGANSQQTFQPQRRLENSNA